MDQDEQKVVQELKPLKTVFVKPLGVNRAYRGRRHSTDELLQFKDDMMKVLPRNIEIPDGKLSVSFIFGISNSGEDIDGPIKTALDALSEGYEFNDNLVYDLHVKKRKTEKGSEFISFEIKPWNPK
mgnify:CR=1 FL=1